MRIQLVTPAPLRLNNGNKITALRWARIFRKLGHRITITQNYDRSSCDLLIALHARRSADSIRTFHKLHPDLPQTRLWGYRDSAAGAAQRHLGGLIIAARGTASRLRFTNTLPPQNILRPGAYDVFISVGDPTGLPTIALPLPDGDGNRRYRLGKITVAPASPKP